MIVDFFLIIFFNSQKVITCQMLNDLISIFFSIFIHFSLIVFVFFWNLCDAKAYAIFDKFYQRL